jgi:hypothetical protein
MSGRGRAAAVVLVLLLACRREHDAAAGGGDTAFTAMQERGRTAMGVDQYTSSHVFEPLPDGGRIVLQRDSADAAGTAAIRAHMRDIAAAFARGDFAVPGFVHAQEVPGTAALAEARGAVTFTADTLPRGGQVRIRTADSALVRAVHEFLAFQRREHHAPAH